MKSAAHETAKKMVTLLKSTYESENANIQILHDITQEIETYRINELIGLGDFSLPINTEAFTLFLKLSWTKK